MPYRLHHGKLACESQTGSLAAAVFPALWAASVASYKVASLAPVVSRWGPKGGLCAGTEGTAVPRIVPAALLRMTMLLSTPASLAPPLS